MQSKNHSKNGRFLDPSGVHFGTQKSMFFWFDFCDFFNFAWDIPQKMASVLLSCFFHFSKKNHENWALACTPGTFCCFRLVEKCVFFCTWKIRNCTFVQARAWFSSVCSRLKVLLFFTSIFLILRLACTRGTFFLPEAPKMTKNDNILVSLISPWGAPGPRAVQLDPLGLKMGWKMDPKSTEYSYENHTKSILLTLHSHFQFAHFQFGQFQLSQLQFGQFPSSARHRNTKSL